MRARQLRLSVFLTRFRWIVPPFATLALFLLMAAGIARPELVQIGVTSVSTLAAVFMMHKSTLAFEHVALCKG